MSRLHLGQRALHAASVHNSDTTEKRCRQGVQQTIDNEKLKNQAYVFRQGVKQTPAATQIHDKKDMFVCL